MCGRYVLEAPDDLSERFHVRQVAFTFRPTFNAAPSQLLPVIVEAAPEVWEARLMHWGLVPRWKNSGKNVSFFADEVLSCFNGYDPLNELADLLPSGFAMWDWLSRAQFLETQIFLSNYLLSSQGDRVAMAHAVEIRLPYLDYRVMDFAATLPAQWKIKGLNEKYILKQASAGFVTEAIRKRPKQPYRAPIREVFFANGAKNDYVDDFLSEGSLNKTGYFNPKKVGLLVNKFRKAGAPVSSEFQNMALVGILSTQILHDQFIENFPIRDVQPIKPDKIIRL